MQIETAAPADAPVLSAIAYAAKASWGYPPTWMAAWAPKLAVSPAYLAAHAAFVAIDADQKVGFAVVEVQGEVASLEHLWVRPGNMRNGVGRELFRRCEHAARLAGAKRMVIESDPQAEGFYLRMGAQRIGEIPAEIDGVKRSLPWLSKRLT